MVIRVNTLLISRVNTLLCIRVVNPTADCLGGTLLNVVFQTPTKQLVNGHSNVVALTAQIPLRGICLTVNSALQDCRPGFDSLGRHCDERRLC